MGSPFLGKFFLGGSRLNCCVPHPLFFEDFLFALPFDNRGGRRDIIHAAAGIEDVAAIAERADRVRDESAGVDDITVRAHAVKFERVDDPVAAQTLGRRRLR